MLNASAYYGYCIVSLWSFHSFQEETLGAEPNPTADKPPPSQRWMRAPVFLNYTINPFTYVSGASTHLCGLFFAPLWTSQHWKS